MITTPKTQTKSMLLGHCLENMMNNKNTESILDKVTAKIRSEQIDSPVVNAAAERVWARLSAENAGELRTETAVDRIENCDDFQSLIPAYLNGHLSEARSLLLVDHTHECIPCRKAMKDARSRSVAPKKAATASRRYSLQPVVLRWGIAAAVVIGFGLLALPFIKRYVPFGGRWKRLLSGRGSGLSDSDTPYARDCGQRLAEGASAFASKVPTRLFDCGWLGDRKKDLRSFRSKMPRVRLFTESCQHRGELPAKDERCSRHWRFAVSVTARYFLSTMALRVASIGVEGECCGPQGGRTHLRPGEQATFNASIESIP